MKTEYIDRDHQEEEEQMLDFVKKHYKVEDVFDLYNHDREVAIRFHKWMMDYNSVHLVDLLADKPQPTMEEMFERFCTQPKQ